MSYHEQPDRDVGDGMYNHGRLDGDVGDGMSNNERLDHDVDVSRASKVIDEAITKLNDCDVFE
ncbi:hypothetical protein DPMN_081709 [Dreissena polymorpha]|uniref:Uncharacterized protein n=1 Tax=Dreissena polymorpha TaxID=45954 RepID=A0A9D4BGS1_DREPO|nr:hypothetical protein DPMN_081709 [Dreissena polymorpha]